MIVPKMKIEIRKPQYLDVKESVQEVKAKPAEPSDEKRTPVFFRLLLTATYILSGLAIWYVYQKYSGHF